ncbi:GTP-binding protein [Ampullimonas aquatilis]|uniref:GTP-binding protein n=1 Tax=Ampullimonas aquatilis TaxID=1341549 RepID=UPI003C716DCA
MPYAFAHPAQPDTIRLTLLLAWQPALQNDWLAQHAQGRHIIHCDLSAAHTLTDEHEHDEHCTSDCDHDHHHTDEHAQAELADDIYAPFLNTLGAALAAGARDIVIVVAPTTEAVLVEDALVLAEEEWQADHPADHFAACNHLLLAADSWLTDLQQAEFLQDLGLAADALDDRTVADLLMEQVESAAVIEVYMPQLSTPQTSTAQNHKTNQINLSSLTGLLHALNPGVQIELPVNLNTANQFGSDASISSWHYQSERAFHPQRLWQLIHSDWLTANGTVIRSQGRFLLASQPTIALQWQHAGGTCRHADEGEWDTLNTPDQPSVKPGQDWQCVGLNLNTQALATALDACLLRDDDTQPLDDPFAQIEI